MSVSFDHRDPGTAESHWDAAAPWAGAPALPLDVEGLVVVAAHPDDETLGAGGLIAAAARRDVPTHVLVLTDGEAADTSRADLGGVRRQETVAALAALSRRATVTFAGLPDGGLREHRDAIRAHLAAILSARDRRTILLAAPWWGDGHRDHRIAGETARIFAGSGVRVVGYPIWLWHWGTPEQIDTSGWRALTLDDQDLDAKRRAIGQHRTQLNSDDGAPILHAGMRQHFERDVEVFVACAPERSGGIEPRWFEDFYARHEDPWGFESRWYEERKRALTVAALPRQRYRHALELGCSTGLLTSLLTERATRVTAVDVVEAALARAAERVSSPSVAFRRCRTPDEWPVGSFDLIVLSELAYYWSPRELDRALERIAGSLADDGEIVLCHWRPAIEGCALTGDDVHAVFAADRRFCAVARYAQNEFLLEIFRRAGDEASA